MLRTWLMLVTLLFAGGLAGEAYAQADTAQRTRDLVAALDKTKYKKKEKKNVSIKLYFEVRNEPVVKANVNDLGGIYEDDNLQFRLTLNILAGGTVEGSGYDTIGVEAARVNFTLKDARIDGALLTGTKVFANGATHKFEAVFVTRTIKTGKNVDAIETVETDTGIGFIQADSDWSNRVFLTRR